MPFAEHESFVAPENPDVRIWRYMDLAKLVSLLKDSALWFARLDRLGDPWEGSYARPNLDIDGEALQRAKASAPDKPWGLYASADMQSTVRSFQKLIYVNCWHMNSHESAAMWDLYARSGYGVAIQSTFPRLGESFVPGPTATDVPVLAGVVRYIDYVTDLVSEVNAFDAVLTKRLSFAHEQEVRAVIFMPDRDEQERMLTYDPGIAAKVDLEQLVERIYVAPGANTWFQEVVQSLVSQYGYGDIEVVASSLDARPLF